MLGPKLNRSAELLGFGFLNVCFALDSDRSGHSGRSSVRDVPLRPALVNEGFLKFVKAAPHGPLVSDLPASKRYGTRGLAASDRYMDWLRNIVGTIDPKIIAYSWRHRMEDELRLTRRTRQRLRSPGRRAKAHARGMVIVFRFERKAEWIAKVPAITP